MMRTLTRRTVRTGLRTTGAALTTVVDLTIGRLLDTDPRRAR